MTVWLVPFRNRFRARAARTIRVFHLYITTRLLHDAFFWKLIERQIRRGINRPCLAAGGPKTIGSFLGLEISLGSVSSCRSSYLAKRKTFSRNALFLFCLFAAFPPFFVEFIFSPIANLFCRLLFFRFFQPDFLLRLSREHTYTGCLRMNFLSFSFSHLLSCLLSRIC